MDAIHYHPGKHPQDTEDLAYEFVEQEVGRHDWKENWPKFKANHAGDGNLEKRVQSWLNYVGIDYDPSEIIRYLDTMVASRSGKWK